MKAKNLLFSLQIMIALMFAVIEFQMIIISKKFSALYKEMTTIEFYLRDTIPCPIKKEK